MKLDRYGLSKSAGTTGIVDFKSPAEYRKDDARMRIEKKFDWHARNVSK